MKIASKGQVTMPQAVREQAGLHPHSEVDFAVRGSANASQFKGMGTDEFMAFLRA